MMMMMISTRESVHCSEAQIKDKIQVRKIFPEVRLQSPVLDPEPLMSSLWLVRTGTRSQQLALSLELTWIYLFMLHCGRETIQNTRKEEQLGHLGHFTFRKKDFCLNSMDNIPDAH